MTLFLLASLVRMVPRAVTGDCSTRLKTLPICTFIGMTLVMVWLAGESVVLRPIALAFSGFVGASLLFIALVWLVSFIADASVRIITAHLATGFLIVRLLHLIT